MVACAVKAEVAFNAGFTTPDADRDWTDVSDRLFGTVSIGWGRSDQFSNCEPLTCSLSLANEDGALTPRNASSPYYPDVKLDRPLRITVTPVGGSDSVRFTGYVDAWPRSWPMGTDGGSVYVDITATSRTGRLGDRGTRFYSDLVEYSIGAGATDIWPITEPAGATRAVNLLDGATLRKAGSGVKVRFNDTMVLLPGGQYLTSSLTMGSNYTIALSFFSSSRGGLGIMPATVASNALLAANDSVWHRLMMTVSGGVASGVDFYLDGDLISANVSAVRRGALMLGRSGRPYAWVRDVAYYPSTLSSGDAATDYAAFNGGFGELPDVRLARYASYVDIDPAEVDADAGTPPMGATDIAGLSPVDAFRVCESTEGGVLTDARDGSLRLIGRGARYYSSPTVTLDMAAEEVSADYSPTLDRFSLRNDVTGTNAATSMGQVAAGSGYSRNATDAASVAEYGTQGGSVEVNAADDHEAYGAASWIVENWSEPADRVPSLSVDLLPLNLAQTEAAMAVFVGDRVKLTNRTAQDANSDEEFFAEGGSETWAADAAALSFNVSPLGLADSVLIFDTDSFDAGKHFAR